MNDSVEERWQSTRPTLRSQIEKMEAEAEHFDYLMAEWIRAHARNFSRLVEYIETGKRGR